LFTRLYAAFAILAATLVIPAAALGYTPQPHQFALQSTIGPRPACVQPGQIVTFSITETNLSKRTATVRVSTDPMDGSPWYFHMVSAKPGMNSATTTYTDYMGNPFSYTIYSWQQTVKPGKPATFAVAVQVPDWNIPSPSNPDGTIFTPPPPQPYPISFSFNTELVGEPGSGDYHGIRLTYCGQPLPPGFGGYGPGK
jgi:hypothetical protein